VITSDYARDFLRRSAIEINFYDLQDPIDEDYDPDNIETIVNNLEEVCKVLCREYPEAADAFTLVMGEPIQAPDTTPALATA
jgi:hypothetical protein